MPQLSLASTDTYVCKTCDVEFSLPTSETPVCCPVCRMNRIRQKRRA